MKMVKKEEEDYERRKEKKTLTDRSLKRQYRVHETRLQGKRRHSLLANGKRR